MNDKQVKTLSAMMKKARVEADLSIREVAKISGINHANVLRLEQGAVLNPRLETLAAITEAIGLDLNDLLANIGYVQPKGLPSFTPYMRSKYTGLPDGAVAELEEAFSQIAAKHGYDPKGPKPGEDET